MSFWMYMLHCNGGRLYIGHTDNLDLRLGQHQAGYFTGYTFKRLPVQLVWNDTFQSRDDAKTVERQIKGWSRAKKEALIAGDWQLVSKLAKCRSLNL